MTQLVARLILTMLILPVAGAVFVLGFIAFMAFSSSTSSGPPPVPPLLGLWGIVYAVIALAWIMIWRPVVRWTQKRIAQTVLSAFVSLLAGAAFGFTIFVIGAQSGMPFSIAVLLGGGVPPIVWICSTVLIWRETRDEQTDRLAGNAPGSEAIVCPTCGYDMRDAQAAHCPECGVKFSIGQLVAAQPMRALQTLDGE